MFIAAQIFSLIAATLMILSVFSDDDRKLKLQSFDSAANVVADAILGGWTGIAVCLGGLLRNNLGRCNIKINKTIMTVGLFLFAETICVFTDRWVLLPVCQIIYTTAVFSGRPRKDLALAIDLAGWLSYDIFIRSYPMAVADLVVLIKVVRDVHQNIGQSQLFSVSAKQSSPSGEVCRDAERRDAEKQPEDAREV